MILCRGRFAKAAMLAWEPMGMLPMGCCNDSPACLVCSISADIRFRLLRAVKLIS